MSDTDPSKSNRSNVRIADGTHRIKIFISILLFEQLFSRSCANHWVHIGVEEKEEEGICPLRTANEGPVRIQYKCLIPAYVFPEMKLLFPRQNYNVLSPSSYTHISVRDLYISRIGLPILCRDICGQILGIYKSVTDTWMWKLGLRPRNSQKRNI